MNTRYIDALTGQDIILNKFGGFKLAEKTIDCAQIDDTSSFPIGEGFMAKTLQLNDTSVNPKNCPLTRRELCLGLLCVAPTDSFVLTAIKVTEDAIERAAALIEWQSIEEYIFDHLLVTSPIAPIGLGSDTLAAAWLARGYA